MDKKKITNKLKDNRGGAPPSNRLQRSKLPLERFRERARSLQQRPQPRPPSIPPPPLPPRLPSTPPPPNSRIRQLTPNDERRFRLPPRPPLPAQPPPPLPPQPPPQQQQPGGYKFTKKTQKLSTKRTLPLPTRILKINKKPLPPKRPDDLKIFRKISN